MVRTVADKKAQLAFLILVTVILLRLPAFSSRLLSNAAWLHLSRANTLVTVRDALAFQALGLFQNAAKFNEINRRAFLGAGMALVLVGDEDAALSSWQQGKISPDILTGLAGWRKSNKMWDEALVYYRAASSLNSQQPNEAFFLAGNICQRTFAQPSLLNVANQIYCQDYFVQNGNNLIVNGQFEGGSTAGWGKIYLSRVGSFADGDDQTMGKPAPSVFITGLREGHHGGLFQGITLPEGTTVRYSAWIKVHVEQDTRIAPLYFGADQNSKPIGSAARDSSGEMTWALPKDMKWTYLERTFQVPKTDGNLVRFFPVLLSGYGTVWVDDIRLEVRPSEE